MLRSLATAFGIAFTLLMMHSDTSFAQQCAKPGNSGTAKSDTAKDDSTDDDSAIRCAVIGGMTDTGLWDAVAERFEKGSGLRSRVVETGPKRVISKAFIAGEADLIVMHACDAMLNLVADGYGENPQPWAKNDLLLVGPADDPAKISGEQDAVAALKKIVASNNRLMMHASLGANEVLHDLLAAGEIELPAEQAIFLPSDRHRELLKRAGKEQAYALVGRIPFRNGKIPSGELAIMVSGDPRMRRPYLVVVATAARIGAARHGAAEKLAKFLRTPETQGWLKEFGRGELDDQPLFFPVKVAE